MIDDVSEILIAEEELHARAVELGRAISLDYAEKPLLLVCILKGGHIFLADLVRAITIPLEIDFMAVSSYGTGDRSSGTVKIVKDISTSVRDKHVLIVEDIVDTGRTLSRIREGLMAQGANSVRICCLLRKAKRQNLAIHLDYLGFEIPDRFAVGYGLDYSEMYRNLPFIGILRSEKYR